MKIQLISLTISADFIEAQYKMFSRYAKEAFDFAIADDSYDKVQEKHLKHLSETLGTEYIRVDQKIHESKSAPSLCLANSLNWLINDYECLQKDYDVVIIMHADVYPFRDVHLISYLNGKPIASPIDFRDFRDKRISYIYPAFVVFDAKKCTDESLDFDFSCGHAYIDSEDKFISCECPYFDKYECIKGLDSSVVGDTGFNTFDIVDKDHVSTISHGGIITNKYIREDIQIANKYKRPYGFCIGESLYHFVDGSQWSYKDIDVDADDVLTKWIKQLKQTWRLKCYYQRLLNLYKSVSINRNIPSIFSLMINNNYFKCQFLQMTNMYDDDFIFYVVDDSYDPEKQREIIADYNELRMKHSNLRYLRIPQRIHVINNPSVCLATTMNWLLHDYAHTSDQLVFMHSDIVPYVPTSVSKFFDKPVSGTIESKPMNGKTVLYLYPAIFTIDKNRAKNMTDIDFSCVPGMDTGGGTAKYYEEQYDKIHTIDIEQYRYGAANTFDHPRFGKYGSYFRMDSKICNSYNRNAGWVSPDHYHVIEGSNWRFNTVLSNYEFHLKTFSDGRLKSEEHARLLLQSWWQYRKIRLNNQYFKLRKSLFEYFFGKDARK